MFVWFSVYIILECLRCIQSCTPTNSFICNLQPGFCVAIRWHLYISALPVCLGSKHSKPSDLESCCEANKAMTIFVSNLPLGKTCQFRRISRRTNPATRFGRTNPWTTNRSTDPPDQGGSSTGCFRTIGQCHAPRWNSPHKKQDQIRWTHIWCRYYCKYEIIHPDTYMIV